MGWLGACARAMTVVVVAGFCAISARAADPLPMLLASPPVLDAGASVAVAPAGMSAVTRQRRVVVDFGYLDPRSAAAAPALGAELFDGQIVTLDRGRIEARAPGNYTWYGKVRGYAHGDVVLTVVDGHVAGSIVVVDAGARASTTFELLSVPGGAQWLRQLDSAGFPPDHPPGVDGRVAPSPPGLLQPGTDVAIADTGATIDVMIVYTNETATAAGSAIAAQSQQAVDRANLAYANSGIVPRLRLVHHAQVNYSEAGLTFESLLDRLTSTSDSQMDEVHAWRDAHGADVVSLFVENGAYCGLGWLNAPAAYAFTVVNRGCAGGNLSFAHEVGHNFGAHHDPAVATNNFYPYGHGYVYIPAKWRTVMAYNDACAGVGGCTRIAYFSNPDVGYGSPPIATGTTATHDNARVHDERAFAVANFRQAIAVAAPTAASGAATAIAPTGATLNGTVSSNGATTTVAFQYGVTTSYGSNIAAAQSPLAAGATGTAVTAAIGGLACSMVHHFRVVGANGVGTTYGGDLAFTTAPCSGGATTTTLTSNANPSATGTAITLTAFVTGTAPAGAMVFRDGVDTVGGCGNVPVSGAGNMRSATCTTNALAVGTHSIVASYGGDAVNAPSASAALLQQVVSALPITGTVVANPYGDMAVQGGTLVGNTITITSPTASIQLGNGSAAPSSYAQIDFDALHIGSGNTLTIRSGAAGQVLVLRNVSATASAIGGTLQAQGGNGEAPPELHVWNRSGIAIAPSGNVRSPSGLSLDALEASWTAGQNIEHAGNADGGAYLALSGANIHGGGAFKGDAIGLHTLGAANNPVNGAYYLQNGLQLYPSTGNTIALTLNGFGSTKQVFNVFANGSATAWMPSAWPAGVSLPPNNAVVMPGGVRAPGVPEPAYGGGSMIVQATGSLTLVGGGTNDFVFPGAIVLKAGGDLNLNGVVVDQGWTTSGQAFQGIFFESPNIVSPNGPIRVYGNDLNWMNFSTLPQQYVRAFSLKRNLGGSASFVATDTSTPHVNTYSVIQNTAASGGCWVCIVNTQPVSMYGP